MDYGVFSNSWLTKKDKEAIANYLVDTKGDLFIHSDAWLTAEQWEDVNKKIESYHSKETNKINIEKELAKDIFKALKALEEVKKNVSDKSDKIDVANCISIIGDLLPDGYIIKKIEGKESLCFERLEVIE